MENGPIATPSNVVLLTTRQSSFELNSGRIGAERTAAFALVNSILARANPVPSAAQFEERLAEVISSNLPTVALEALDPITSDQPSRNSEIERLRRAFLKLKEAVPSFINVVVEESKGEGAIEKAAEDLVPEAVVKVLRRALTDSVVAEVAIIVSTVVTECSRGLYSSLGDRIRGGLLQELLKGKGRFEITLSASEYWVSKGKHSVALVPPAVLIRDSIATLLKETYSASEAEVNEFLNHWNRSYRALAHLAPKIEVATHQSSALERELFAPSPIRDEFRRDATEVPAMPEETKRQIEALLSERRAEKTARHFAHALREVPVETGSLLQQLRIEAKAYFNLPFSSRKLPEVIEALQLSYLGYWDSVLSEGVIRAELGLLRRAEQVIAVPTENAALYLDNVPTIFARNMANFKGSRANAAASALLVAEVNSISQVLDGKRRDHQLVARQLFSNESLGAAQALLAKFIIGDRVHMRNEHGRMHGELRRAFLDPSNSEVLRTLDNTPGILLALASRNEDYIRTVFGNIGELVREPGNSQALAKLADSKVPIFQEIGISEVEY